MYKPKSKTLQEYLDENKAISAEVHQGEVLISVQDVDIIIMNVLKKAAKQYTELRDAQNRYFVAKSHNLLREAKDIEKKLDGVAAKILEPKNLFS